MSDEYRENDLTNNTFAKDQRVEAYMSLSQPVFGTVATPKTAYGRVVVEWDNDQIEDTHLREWDLTKVTPEEERATAIEEACLLLERHDLTYSIQTKDGEVLASK